MVHTTFVLLLSIVLAAMVFSISFIEAVVSTNNGTGGFSIELVHRDSPLSPFYNHSETSYHHFNKSILRSMSRVDYLNALLSSTNLDSTTDTIQSQVIPAAGGGSYLMTFSIGTPPIKFLAIADTGSDLIWTQCKPCQNCYEQDLPLFDPETSSTYRGVSCESNHCQSLKNGATCENNTCEYSYSYGDKSKTNGILATETFTFDSTDDHNQRKVMIPMLAFGCGHNNAGIFSSHGSGLVGLGGGPLSLVSQLGSKIDGKFSYCLVDIFEDSASSKLNFGSQAIISEGNNVVSTPLVSRTPVTFYYLTLEAISVDGQRFESSKPAEGNIFIDSGTTLTTLPKELYNQFESTLRKAILDVPITDPRGQYKLCYSTRSKFEVPDMMFHFNGADVSLTGLNTFWKVSDDLVCLTIAPTEADDDTPIYGNLAQINFLIEYDLVGRKVSFAPTDCTKY